MKYKTYKIPTAMFIFFIFTACALLLFVAGLQIWLYMNNSVPTQKKTDKKPVLTRYQFLLTGLLFLFLVLGSCVTSYDSVMENRPAKFCQEQSNKKKTISRNISKDTQSAPQIILVQDTVTKIISSETTRVVKKDACIQETAGNNKLEQSINLYLQETQPAQSVSLFPNDCHRIAFQILIGIICVVLLLLLIASFVSSYAKYKYKCKAKMSKYNRDIEIKKLSEKEAFYRGYYSSINNKD